MHVVSVVAALLFLSALPLDAAIRGNVLTSDGKPLAGASVDLFRLESSEERGKRIVSERPERTPLRHVTSGDDGGFSIELEGEAAADLSIRANGFAPRTFFVNGEDDLAGVLLAPAVMKEGKVTAAGKPVKGAAVIYSGFDGTELLTRTGEEGTYQVPDPARWALRQDVYHPSFAPLTDDRQRSDELTSAPALELEVKLEAGKPLSGRALSGEKGVIGARVFVDGWLMGTTGEEGRFEIGHAPSAPVSIFIATDTLMAVTSKIPPGGTIALKKSVRVAGSVKERKSGKGVAGAKIMVFPYDDSPIVTSAISDRSGKFELRLTPLQHEIEVRAPGLIQDAKRDDYVMDLRTWRDTTRVITLERVGRITGRVVDEEGKGIAGTILSPVIAGMNLSGLPVASLVYFPATAMDGRFSIRDGINRQGELRLTAQSKGYGRGESEPFDVEPGIDRKGAMIRLSRGITVNGRVTDQKGKPVRGAAILAIEREPAAATGSRPEQLFPSQPDDSLPKSDGDGKFTLTLGRGSYDVAAKSAGHPIQTVRGYKAGSGSVVEIVLEEGFELRGRLVRPNGSGVAGVSLAVASGEYRSSEPVSSGSDGSFKLGSLPKGTFVLYAHSQEKMINETRTVTVPGEEIEIKLNATGIITGRVSDALGGTPVEDYSVFVGPKGNPGAATSHGGSGRSVQVNAADGTFRLEEIPAGEVDLTFRAKGYASRRLPSLLLEAEKPVEPLDVRLDRGVTVRGEVKDDSGKPLGGVYVYADRQGQGERSGGDPGSESAPVDFVQGEATTDEDGNFLLEGVPGGELTLQFSKEGFVGTKKELKLEGREQRVDAILSRGKSIAGRVVTADGRPIANAFVSASSAAMESDYQSEETDDAGRFVVAGLKPGRYDLHVMKQGFSRSETSGVDTESPVPLTVTLKKASKATVFGSVLGVDRFGATHGRGVLVQGQDGSARGTIDGNGSYRIENAPSGRVTIRAALDGAMRTRYSSSRTAELLPGSETRVDLDFSNTHVIRGRVTRAGKPVPNSQVAFYAAGNSGEAVDAMTDGDGAYEAFGLEEGRHRVSVHTFDGASFDTDYEVRESGQFDIDVQGVTVRGVVLDESSGEPLANAAVSIRKKGSGEGTAGYGRPQESLSTAAGGFELKNLPAGSYTVRASRRDYGHATVDVLVGRDAGPDLRIELAKSGGLIVKVVDARDGKLLRGIVIARDSRGLIAFDGNAQEEKDGSFRLPLSPGTYRISASAQGFATSTIATSLPSSGVTLPLTPGGTIIVQSTNESTRPAKLILPSGEEYIRCECNGIAEFFITGRNTKLENIAPGTYKLEVANVRLGTKSSHSVTVAEGGSVTVQID